MRKLITFLAICIIAVTQLKAQDSLYKCLKIEHKNFSDYPIISVDFSIFGHNGICKFRNFYKKDLINLVEEENILKSFTLEPLGYPIPERIVFIADNLNPEDIKWLIKNLDDFSQFSSEYESSIEKLIIVQKNKQATLLPIQEVKPSDSLKFNMNQRDFSDMINDHNMIDSTTVVAIISKNNTESSLRSLVVSSQKTELPLVAFINIGEDHFHYSEIESIVPNNSFIYRNISKKDKNKSSKINIAPLIEQWLNRRYRLSYTTQKPLESNGLRSLSFVSSNKDFQPITFKIDVPVTIVENHQKEEVSPKIETFISKKEYQKAMELVNTTNREMEKVSLNDLAWLTIVEYGQHLAATKADQSLASFNAFQNLWNEKAPKDTQKEILKVYLQFYDNISDDASNQKQMADIAQVIYELQPTKQNHLRYRLSKGKWYEGINQKWKAIAEYDKACSLNTDEQVISKTKTLLLKACEEDFKATRYLNIIDNTPKYKSYFTQQFRQNYILAEAYRRTDNYRESEIQYKWLIDNWTDQNYLDWFAAFENYQNILSMNYKFDAAIELNQRIFNKNKDKHSVELSLFYSRAKLCKPIIDIFPSLIKRLGSFAYIKDNLNMGIIETPKWLAGITLTDDKMKPIIDLYKSKNYISIKSNELNKLKAYPTIKKNYQTNNYWLINKVNADHYIVIQIANGERTTKEMMTFQAILNDKYGKQNWFNLFSLEEDLGVKFCSQMLSRLLETDYNKTNQIALNDYWKILKKNNFLQFICFHSSKGNDVVVGKTLDKKYYPNNNYQRSAKTIAYFEQQITFDNTTYYDITNPIFNPKWAGTIRIGIEKYFTN